jgi:hypothetical protein
VSSVNAVDSRTERMIFQALFDPGKLEKLKKLDPGLSQKTLEECGIPLNLLWVNPIWLGEFSKNARDFHLKSNATMVILYCMSPQNYQLIQKDEGATKTLLELERAGSVVLAFNAEMPTSEKVGKTIEQLSGNVLNSTLAPELSKHTKGGIRLISFLAPAELLRRKSAQMRVNDSGTDPDLRLHDFYNNFTAMDFVARYSENEKGPVYCAVEKRAFVAIRQDPELTIVYGNWIDEKKTVFYLVPTLIPGGSFMTYDNWVLLGRGRREERKGKTPSEYIELMTEYSEGKHGAVELKNFDKRFEELVP